MCVPIIFCSQPKHERRNNKKKYALFCWSKNEFLTETIKR
jgi:hypothetical protein